MKRPTSEYLSFKTDLIVTDTLNRFRKWPDIDWIKVGALMRREQHRITYGKNYLPHDDLCCSVCLFHLLTWLTYPFDKE